jgi:hypothetical protein
VELEVAIGRAARGGSFAGSALICGDVSSGHPLDLHIPALEQPLVALLQQHGANQPGDAGLVREDADDVGPST